MTSVFVRIEVVDCFIQKPSSIVTSVFFITSRPLYAQIILDECIGLLAIVEWSVTCPESRLLGQVDYISYGVVKWLTELFTLSLLPVAPIESTVK